MNFNNFSRLISTSTNTHTNTSHKLYSYFKKTPHFVFMNFNTPSISRVLQFPNVQRITLVSSKYQTVNSMINANIFPNLTYLRHFVDISTPQTTVDDVEAKLKYMTKFLDNRVDCEVSYLDFNNPSHVDIKNISNNFSGFNVGNISNTLYSQCLTEYIKATHNDYMSIINSIHSEDSHLLQEIEELQLQRQQVLAENGRGDLH
jgi:hypothetical protein